MKKFFIFTLFVCTHLYANTITNVHGIVFAAGKSTRFGTGDSKLRTKINGKPLILYPVEALCTYNIPTTLVINFQKDAIKQVIHDAKLDAITFAEQKERKGTGAALAYTREYWDTDHILVINGDMALRNKSIIKQLYDAHIKAHADITFVTAYTPDEPLARVIVDEQGTRIVEIKHFTGNLKEQPYSNVGIYIFKRSFLEKYIDEIELNPHTHEYYVTSLIEIANNNGYTIETIDVSFDDVRGINTQQELEAAQKVIE